MTDTHLATPLLLREAFIPESQSVTQKLPWWVWVVAGAFVLWGAMTANPLVTPLAIALLPVIIRLLWRRGEPPALAFACAMQWVQAAAAIFYTNFYGIPLALASEGPEFETATWLSLFGVLVLAIGMRVGLIRTKDSQENRIIAGAIDVNVTKIFYVYLVSLVFSAAAMAVAFRVSGLRQLLSTLAAVKWVMVFVLAYCVMKHRRGYLLLAVTVVLEFGLGLLGFFAGFKSIFFVLLVVALSSSRALQGRRLLATAVSGIAIFVFGIMWTAIKSDYRDFLNQGSGNQEVLVPVEQRLDKMQDLLASFTWDRFTEGLDAMILRVSYVKYFALTIANVPDKVPYENGALWLGSLQHVITPRLLFPNKAVIDDSERTTLYTGIQVAGMEEGTSIGLGYMAESYIDFGPRLMFLPVFLLGIFYGLIYRAFVIHARHKLLGSAIASSILIFGAYTIETSNIKIIGGNVMVLLVMSFLYLMAGRWFRRGLKGPVVA